MSLINQTPKVMNVFQSKTKIGFQDHVARKYGVDSLQWQWVSTSRYCIYNTITDVFGIKEHYVAFSKMRRASGVFHRVQISRAKLKS
jgi:hypothetical protein